MVDELSKKFKNEGISHLFGTRIYHCCRKCCLNDDTTCVSSHCEEQSGEKHYGLCPVINPPTSLVATSNHIYLLIYCNNAPQSSTFARNAFETHGVNWTLEGAVQTVKVFWETFVYGGSQWFPGNSKTSLGFLLTFCRFLLSTKFPHQYIWWSVFKNVQKCMDFEQWPQASLSETLARPQVKNLVGDTLSQYVWDCVEKKQLEPIVFAYWMTHAERGRLHWKENNWNSTFDVCCLLFYFFISC